MIYDKELDQWILSEFHRDRYMRCQEWTSYSILVAADTKIEH